MTGTCIPCGNGCAECKTARLCDLCNPGNYLTASGNCAPCDIISDCLECGSPTLCFRCKEGFRFDPVQNTCVGCGNVEDKCAVCAPNGKCQKCPLPNMYIDETTERCSYCPVNCEMCDITGKCQLCKNGYSYERSTNTCSGCSANATCKICSFNNLNCLSCMPNFYVDDTSKTCLPCPEGCSSCVDS